MLQHDNIRKKKCLISTSDLIHLPDLYSPLPLLQQMDQPLARNVLRRCLYFDLPMSTKISHEKTPISVL